MDNKKETSRFHITKNVLIFLGVAIVFAYGFQVTEINLEEPKEEKRQKQLANVIRALAKPDLFEYETDRLETNAGIMVPCPPTQFSIPDYDQPAGLALQLSSICAEPGSEITIKGSGYQAGDEILIFFVPYKEDESEEVQLPLAKDKVAVDADGTFSQVVELRDDRTSENAQKVRAVVNRKIGWPSPSETVYDTFDKIIETIFLAFIATVFGIIIAVPLSFLAARNLMINVTTAFGTLMTIIFAVPIGWYVGWQVFDVLGGFGTNLLLGTETASAALLFGPAIILLSVQTMSKGGGNNVTDLVRSYGLAIAVGLGSALGLGLIAGLGQTIGLMLVDALPKVSFIGNFIYVMSDALAIFLPVFGAMAGLFMAISIASTASDSIFRQTGNSLLSKGFSVVMSVFAGMVIFAIPAALLFWLYQPVDPTRSMIIAIAIGGVVLGVIGLITAVDHPVPTGIILYYFARTIFNIQRAIEPLILVIVFVVWVGIGPFAGTLALTLHTIAALGKLYSEQVENIAQGPIEAVTATGANHLQTIIYAVMPQIVPPYIAFTIYRWDINVRMSTIIGFGGGGGIGFLLLQNLNLLKYRQAAVQILAIAIVVASLDYVSARIREKII